MNRTPFVLWLVCFLFGHKWVAVSRPWCARCGSRSFHWDRVHYRIPGAERAMWLCVLLSVALVVFAWYLQAR